MKAAAPGKLVLSGAYSVLEGAPAIVTAVDRYVIADTSSAPSFLTPEVEAAFKTSGNSPPAFDASALREGEEKLGIGSSAAIVVASLAAVVFENNPGLDDAAWRERLLHAAMHAHGGAQGGGSGLDVAASVFGGTIEYRRGPNREPLAKSVAWPASALVEAWWSGVSASTREILGRVRSYKEQKPRVHAALLKAQGDASERAASAIASQNVPALIQSLRDQCGALLALGIGADVAIVTPEVEALAQVGNQEGAAVLPSGAGGGDVFLYVGTSASSAKFRATAAERGQRLLKLDIGARGVHQLGS